MSQLILKTTISFDAPIAKVWHGLTDPTTVKQYFFGTNLKSDWKVGSPITFSGEWEGKTYTDRGVILEIDAPKLLKYAYWSSMAGTEDQPENYANITYELTEDKGKTNLTLTQDNIKSEEAVAHSEKNWQLIFGGLNEILKKDK